MVEYAELDMAAKTVAVEQRAGGTIVGELAPHRRQECRLRGELERQRLVICEAVRHQVRQASGLEHAGSDPAGKGVAGAGDDRQPGKQGVTRCRVRVVGQRVEKQIRGALAGEMILDADRVGRENDPVRRHAARRGEAAQIGLRHVVHIGEPQHTAWKARQQAHPDVEHRRGDLVALIEAAEDEASVGQPELAAGRCLRGNAPGRVVRVVAARHVHDPFGKEGLLVERQRVRVGEDVVDERRPGRSRKSEIADLDGCGAIGEDVGPATAGEPVEIDGDVHVEIVQQPGDLAVGGGRDLVELVERLG